jgi:hypothetical protein
MSLPDADGHFGESRRAVATAPSPPAGTLAPRLAGQLERVMPGAGRPS